MKGGRVPGVELVGGGDDGAPGADVEFAVGEGWGIGVDSEELGDEKQWEGVGLAGPDAVVGELLEGGGSEGRAVSGPLGLGETFCAWGLFGWGDSGPSAGALSPEGKPEGSFLSAGGWTVC